MTSFGNDSTYCETKKNGARDHLTQRWRQLALVVSALLETMPIPSLILIPIEHVETTRFCIFIRFPTRGVTWRAFFVAAPLRIPPVHFCTWNFAPAEKPRRSRLVSVKLRKSTGRPARFSHTRMHGGGQRRNVCG